MSDEPESLILRSLRRIEAGLDGLREDMREVKTRVGLLEQQVALLSTRVDRLELRLERIERRLDLVEA
jgi:predicted nuclease with TOPRIM domain